MSWTITPIEEKAAANRILTKPYTVKVNGRTVTDAKTGRPLRFKDSIDAAAGGAAAVDRFKAANFNALRAALEQIVAAEHDANEHAGFARSIRIAREALALVRSGP